MVSTDIDKPYRVLARKYRPQNFADLIGQEALVRTLTNAIQTNRIAQAYILTGIRGVGKTTTARIIAKALNYSGGPTIENTSDCHICQAITEDRHPDIIEMDAASRTGIDDIRELIDGVRYAPVEARYKVYIIDEVHMLSKQAFNGLLKTLEEPPPQVIFIFATTEIRKVPITILSRCQRFDLRRVDLETLQKHYSDICKREEVGTEKEALTLIARAADGSVRDGLSILDQAIAMSEETISKELVRSMLGLADENQTLDLLEHILKGNIEESLNSLDNLYSYGTEPLTLLQDLLDHVHSLTRLRAVPSASETLGLTSDQLARLHALSESLSMATLSRAWQMMLKGIEELQQAPQPQTALEMLIIRLCYTADLPDPADMIKKIKSGKFSDASGASSSTTLTGGDMIHAPSGNENVQAAYKLQEDAFPDPQSLEEIVSLLEESGKFQLASLVKHHVRLIRLGVHRLEYTQNDNAPASLASDLTQALKTLTNRRWVVVHSSDLDGQPTLAEKEQSAIQSEINTAMEHPLVHEVMQRFPTAKIKRITHCSTRNE